MSVFANVEGLTREQLQGLVRGVEEHAIVSMTDAQGRITFVNDRFSYVSGYAADELLGQDHSIINSGYHDQAFFADMWSTIAAGKTWKGRVCNRRKDGALYWVSSTIVPILDAQGVPLQYVSVRTDITEERRHAEALKEREGRFRHGHDFAQIGTWDWDLESGDLYWSEQIYTLFGYTPEAWEHTYENFLKAVHPEDRNAVVTAINECVDGGKPYDIEHRVIWPDGTVRWLHESGNVTRCSSGQPLHMIGVVRDITERKQVEAQLVEARKRAEQANQAKSEFISRISHELRTPLYAILGYSELAEQSAREASVNREHMRIVRNAGEHLLGLIDELLLLTKTDSGKLEVNLASLPLGEILPEVIEWTRPLAQEQGIVLVDNSAPWHRTMVRGDGQRLKQVVLNLLSNAVKYNRPGGQVVLGCVERGPERLRIYVEDTGLGIEPERECELFQPFSRLGAEATDVEGSGIGLALSKQLMLLQEGDIGYTRLAEGSRFWIEIACIQGGDWMSERQVKPLSVPHRHTSSERMLVVEDSETNRQLLRQQLVLLGYEAEIVCSGEEAYSRWTQGGIALLLTDYHMPGMNGFELTQRIRRAESERGLERLPIIVLSASAFEGDLQRGYDAGIDDYLTKPILLKALREKLQQWLPSGAHPPPQEAEQEDRSQPEEVESSAVLDLSKLRELLGDDPQMHSMIVRTFLDASPANLASLYQAIESRDAKELAFYAHRQKSASASVGAVELTDMMRRLEQLAYQQEWAGVDELMAQLEHALAAYQSSATAWLATFKQAS